MEIQVLVATINQKDYSLVEKMHIATPAIVCNQCGKYGVAEVDTGEGYWPGDCPLMKRA